MPARHFKLEDKIKWQKRIIRHDQWVIRTRAIHRDSVVMFARHQLKWTKQELRESLSVLHSQQPFGSFSSISSSFLYNAFLCIHRYEGAWDAATGNGYYGGLQMDLKFQSTYGMDFLHKWGTADNWPVWAQIMAASRAYYSGRGFFPWPNTARACGLI